MAAILQMTISNTFSCLEWKCWNFVKKIRLFSSGPFSNKSAFVNTLRPRRNEQHFTDDIFKRIFFNENVWISIKISLKFVPKGPINNIPALVQIMAWRRSGDKPLSEPMMVSLLTHICVTRPQWVKIMTCFLTSDKPLSEQVCTEFCGTIWHY